MKWNVLAIALVLAQVPCFADEHADGAAAGHATCPPGAHSASLDAARHAMQSDERALDPLLKFADVLLAQGCYAEAVHVLEDGETFHSRNGGIQSRLRTARSMLSEQRYFDGLDSAAASARNERNLLRCRQLGDLTACEEALRTAPNDASVLGAKADALIKANRLADAIPTYQRALEIAPDNAVIQSKARDAETKRQAALAECLNGQADSALQGCQIAQLRGASDERTVLVRKAMLLQSMDRPAQALDAYIAASVLKVNDPAVARAIVALTESTGRNDALTLSARGNALLTLGRGTDALKALQQARQLAPTLPDLNVHLAAAEKLARAETRKKNALAAAVAPPLPPPPVSPPAARTYSNQGTASRTN